MFWFWVHEIENFTPHLWPAEHHNVGTYVPWQRILHVPLWAELAPSPNQPPAFCQTQHMWSARLKSDVTITFFCLLVVQINEMHYNSFFQTYRHTPIHLLSILKVPDVTDGRLYEISVFALWHRVIVWAMSQRAVGSAFWKRTGLPVRRHHVHFLLFLQKRELNFDLYCKKVTWQVKKCVRWNKMLLLISKPPQLSITKFKGPLLAILTQSNILELGICNLQ